MNRMRNIFASVCSALVLAFSQGQAQTILWADNFETNAASHWISTGVWTIGSPSAGPPVNSTGYRTHSGANCATTQNYPYSRDVQLVCTRYLNGSNTLVVPAAGLSPTLNFWHWYAFANALGYVEVNAGSNGWQQVSPTYYDVNSGGVWEQASLDLSAFAGKSVQIAFHFTSGNCCGNAKGWYVDDVSLSVTVTNPPVLTVPGPQTIYAGQTLVVTNSATNSLLPNSTYAYKLLSPPANASIATNGVLTWPTTIAQPPGNYTFTVKATDTTAAALTATNSFVVTVINPWVPALTVPPTQNIYAGQTLTVTNYATNNVFPGDNFTFALLHGMTNADVSDLPTNGVINWTNTTAVRAGNYTNVVKVTDNNTQFSATNSFLIVVSNPPPPVLTVPSTQMIFAGQPLTVTNYATNIVFTNDTFTYFLLSGLTNVNAGLDTSDLAADGVLTWNTTTALKAGSYTNVIKATDNDRPTYSATNRFVIIVSNPPPPVMTVPARQTVYAGRLLDVTLSATNDAYPNAVYSFATRSAPAGVTIVSQDANDAELTWRPTAAQATNIYTLSVKATDDNSPSLSVTNSFLVIVAPAPPPPTLIFPQPTPTNRAGQTLAMVIAATNPVLPDAQFTFRLPSPSTNYWIATNGVLTWTNTGIVNNVLTWTNNSVSPGTNFISVIVTDDTVPALSATNSFALVFLPPLPPTLIAPASQMVSAGQTLTVTISATNAFLPNASYTFSLPTPSTNVSMTANGLLTWTNTAAGFSTNLVSVKVTDNSVPPLSATNSFNFLVVPTPPVLGAPSLTAGSHSFSFSFQTASNTTWRIQATTNLTAAANWVPIATNTAGVSGFLQFTDLLATNFLQRYYRAVYP